MKKADVIIGSNFGDEGKGLVTDFLSAQHGDQAIVIRFNGGAQAGHTVQTADGRRHVFSHFGSGSFAGAATFLSHFFVCNPLLFVKEYALLQSKSVRPRVCVDRRAPVTTPYDMMINQIAEETRGKNRHGSCGVGFGETIERMQHDALSLTYADLMDTASTRLKILKIRDEWMPQRLKMLGVDTLPPQWQDRIQSVGVIQKFTDDTAQFLGLSTGCDAAFLNDAREHLIFEGAQGLLLDQERGTFPHVTRSHTGLKNVLLLAKDAGITDLNAHYITRAYATRHGAGPFDHELAAKPYDGIQDATNIDNDYQGSLRFGWLDTDRLASSIAADLSDAGNDIRIAPILAVTCLDQLEADVTFVTDGAPVTGSHDVLVDTLNKRIRPSALLKSHGPTRQTIST